MITPRLFIAGFIDAHEGGLSLHKSDNGNWYSAVRYDAGKKQLRGEGVLVGSKFGVTAYALVRYRLYLGVAKAKALSVDRTDIDAITRDQAIEIGVALYYLQPRLDRLPWNRVTASILDKAWGSGPERAVKMVQQMLGFTGADVDGDNGPVTAGRFATWLKQHGEEHAAHLWCEKRIAFDQELATNEGPNDPDRAFVGGWNNRSRSFLPGTKWWKAAA